MSEQIILVGVTGVLITPIYFMLAHLNNQITHIQTDTTNNSVAIAKIEGTLGIKEK